MIASLTARLAEGTGYAVLLGLAIGVLLGLSPISLPSVPAVVAMVAPRQLDEWGDRRRWPLLRSAPAVLAFVVGMDGVLASLGVILVEVTVILTRGAVVLHLLAAVLLAILGLRLLTRRTSLCDQARAVPPTPGAALVYGTVFAVTGCPGCGPIAIGVGTAAAAAGGPLTALAVISAFVVGRAAVLLAAAAAGARFVRSGTDPRWAWLDLIVGVLFLAGSAYYVFRLLHGDVSTQLPGEGTLLP